MESMNRAIELAKRTWYPKDHPLYYDLHYPLGKLVGEWGELLDDYMKHLYKPGYQFNPKGELIDIWYYIRILAYQTKAELKAFPITGITDIERIIANAICLSCLRFKALCGYRERDLVYKPDGLDLTITSNYSALVHLCNHFNLTIDQLTEASWEKLKPGSERGEEWMRGRKYGRSENKGAL